MPAAAQVPNYVPTDGLVGWWPFNGNANDESGNGNDGVVNGATLTEDRFGNTAKAYDFEGITNSQINVNSDNQIASDTRSYCLWFTASTESSTPYDHLLTSDNSCGCDYLSINGTEPFYVQQNTVGQFYDGKTGLSNDYNLYDNIWHHIVLIHDYFQSTAYLFIDGILVSSNLEVSQFSNVTPLQSFAIGGSWVETGSTAHNGKIDDIAIYNRALTAQEIQNLYTGTTPEPCAALPSNLQQGLVGYWPFCGNANDESGNGNDGTVNGATLTEDRFGNDNAAYFFDGNDWIVVPDNNSLDITQELTLSAWINLSSINSFNCIISKDMNATDEGYRLDILNNKLRMIKTNSNNSQGNSVLDENFWIHTLVTFQNDTINYYLNGESDGTFFAQGSITPTLNNLTFGVQNQISTLQFVNGSLDDIGIWNRALTPEEVQELYTLDACTFTVYDTSYVTVYDTLTTYETVFDTLYTFETLYETLTTYETLYDTLTTYETSFDTLITYETLYDTLTTFETAYDTLTTYETLFDTLTTYETSYDTLTTYETLFDTLTTYETLYDTLTTYETIVDTLYEYETITTYDTVTTYVTVTDTLLIDITFTGFEGQPSWLNTVTVFPNPASDQITIDYGNFALMAGYNTIITDAAGATVYSSAVNSQQVEVDINAWGAMGVYYMSVYDASGELVAVRHIVLE